ncbi:MAG: hypothetical protein NC918_08285 [Candidatus Omnitrophica bacterium]|nr:hypothetical protein [Candidatus Omnitrophota bacterium]
MKRKKVSSGMHELMEKWIKENTNIYREEDGMVFADMLEEIKAKKRLIAHLQAEGINVFSKSKREIERASSMLQNLTKEKYSTYEEAANVSSMFD